MVCASVIVADHDPLVVSGANGTLAAETDSDMAASCSDAAECPSRDTGHSTLVDTSVPGLSEHRRHEELEGGRKIANTIGSRHWRGQTCTPGRS